MPEKVTITKSHYDYLSSCEDKIIALEEYGVESWDSYEEAMASIEED